MSRKNRITIFYVLQFRLGRGRRAFLRSRVPYDVDTRNASTVDLATAFQGHSDPRQIKLFKS